MRRVAGIVAILLLLSAAAPVMACVTSIFMSAEEDDCCRAMHGQCAGMAKMGCCRTEVKPDETPRIAASSPATDVEWACVAYLPAAPAQADFAADAFSRVLDDHSPPGLVAAKTTVLRI